jgi:replication-associated recombination protein RarA
VGGDPDVGAGVDDVRAAVAGLERVLVAGEDVVADARELLAVRSEEVEFAAGHHRAIPAAAVVHVTHAIVPLPKSAHSVMPRNEASRRSASTPFP